MWIRAGRLVRVLGPAQRSGRSRSPELSERRDKACSPRHFITESGIGASHGGIIFWNTISLQTLAEMDVEGVVVSMFC